MTSRERIARILRREPVDRVGVYEGFWPSTIARWTAEGRLRAGEDPNEHFDLDIAEHRPLNFTADIAAGRQVIGETDQYIDYRDGNRSTLRKIKAEKGSARHIDFAIRERADWEKYIKPLLTATPGRINLDAWRQARAQAAARGRFFCLGNRLVFQLMELICGHEYMLMGAATDPDWFRDMADTYADMLIGLMKLLFAEGGKPDGLWLNEDLGFKERPFMAAQMYRDLLQPAHRKVMGFAHQSGLPVIFHSCGCVEMLLQDVVDTGIDCLQVMEIKAGMDPVSIKRRFGDRMALCGGMDARNLISNDTEVIRRELAMKIPALMEGSGYILHSDHSITDQVSYDTYRFFRDEGLALGTYGR